MINTSYLNDFNSPIRQINGKVELLKDSTSTQLGEIVRVDNIKPLTKLNLRAKSKNLIPFPYYYNSRTINGVDFTVNENLAFSITVLPLALTAANMILIVAPTEAKSR